MSMQGIVQGHAGTIPMPMRKDPMAAASEIISWVERRCGGGSYPEPGVIAPSPEDALMCTTGSITLWPNAFNVVPGSANFSLDIRYQPPLPLPAPDPCSEGWKRWSQDTCQSKAATLKST